MEDSYRSVLPPTQHPLMHTHTHTYTHRAGGVAMVNNQPMPVPNRMGGNPAAGYNMIESGVQPVRTVPNPSYPTPRPPGAPQVKIYACSWEICFTPLYILQWLCIFDVFGFAL